MPEPEAPLLNEILESALVKVTANATAFGHKVPTFGNPHTGRYLLSPHVNDWSSGYWAGLLWLTFVATGNPAIRTLGREFLEPFRARLEKRVRLGVDIGPVYLLGARANHQLSADPAARELALRAADELLGFYRIQHKCLLSAEAVRGSLLQIDTLMSLPLLWWAQALTGDSRYGEAALHHADTTLTRLLRPDGSVHAAQWPDGTPETLFGFRPGSVWARGQAYAIYGFTLAAEWTGEQRYISAALHAARYFMGALPETAVPNWDFDGEAPRLSDSAAAAIAAGGMLRLARITAAYGREWLMAAAQQLMIALIANCLETVPNAQGLLRHGVWDWPARMGVDSYVIAGDYFFVETLLALQNRAPDFWGLVGY